MARTFWEAYQLFLERARQWTGEEDERRVVDAVRKMSRMDPAGFQDWARTNGWGRSYVERHYLYVADHPEEVRELLRRGYPVRRIPLKGLDLEALAGALQEEDWREKVDRLFGQARLPDWIDQPVWLFDSTPELRAREALARPVAEALVELYCPAGGSVVDPMAGTGELVEAAKRSGRSAWGGDVHPQSDHVVQADVEELLSHVAPRSADLLILHPPTFQAWAKSSTELPGSPQSEHYALYLEFIASLLKTTRPAVKPGGRVILIARPTRNGHVYLAPFELALGERGLVPKAYRLAVSRDGREDWHFFIARQPEQERKN